MGTRQIFSITPSLQGGTLVLSDYIPSGLCECVYGITGTPSYGRGDAEKITNAQLCPNSWSWQRKTVSFFSAVVPKGRELAKEELFRFLVS